MDRTERFHKIENRLRQQASVSFAQLQSELEVSVATLRRDLRYLRDRFDEPIVWDPQTRGYRWRNAGQQPRLPGPWYSASEIHAILTLEQLLAQLDPAGVLAQQVAPLRERLQRLLEGQGEAAELRNRVRVIGLARRKVQAPHFQQVVSALAQRHRLRIVYRARSTAAASEREVSPLRLMHYRDNWYLDAWCHLREGLRNFAVDAIEQAHATKTRADDMEAHRLDDFFAASYGIFAGREVRWARLRFGPERARWVASEEWHPQQKGRWDEEGRWLLDFPYADPRELVMDILRHVPEVEVLGPVSLKGAVRGRLEAGVNFSSGAG